ncbi:MAG: hypothetical protein E6K80_13815, partial [Candidatus Eisenbacteria bacterium]
MGGARFAPEFAGESAPADPIAVDFRTFYLVDLPKGAELGDALDRFRALPEVISASPIPLVATSAVSDVSAPPNDSLAVGTGGWWIDQVSDHDVDALEAWGETQGDTSLVVAIIDTGVVPYHPDLGGDGSSHGQIWTNWREEGGAPGVDDDGNGFIDDVAGWDFVDLPDSTGVTPGEDWRDQDGDPNDFVGHGTVVAGLVGAIANNRIGVAGVAWKVRLMPLRVGWSLTERQTGVVDMSFVAQAVRYATRMHVAVLNLSLSTEALIELQSAIVAAERAGLVVVVASGNNGSSDYLGTVPGVISVAASDRYDQVPRWSNVGPQVALAAPGAAVASTSLTRVATDSLGLRQSTYIPDANGTSFAAAVTSGAVTLVQARRSSEGLRPLTSAQMRLVLMRGADDISAENPLVTGYGAGRLNIPRSFDVSSRVEVGGRGARVLGPAAVLPTHTGDPWLACVTSDRRFVILGTPALDTVAAVTLDDDPLPGVAAADLGGGRGLGIFVTSTHGRIAGFTGGGRPLPGWPVTASAGPAGVALGDLDGDGEVEIVYASADSRLWIWEPNGSARPGFPLRLPAGGLGIPTALALADLDLRPGAEILFTQFDGTVHAVRGDGRELAGWPVTSTDDAVPGAPVVAATPEGAEVVVACPQSIRGIRADGTTRFRHAWSATPNFDLAVGDLDGDGADDVVIATGAAVQAIHADGEPLTGQWPFLRGTSETGALLIGGAPGQRLVLEQMGGAPLALAPDGSAQPRPTSIPIAGAYSSLTMVHDTSWLFTQSWQDSTWYGLQTTARLAEAAPWPTSRGNQARSGSRLDPAPLAEVAPDPVTRLAAAAVTDTSALLSWIASGDDGMLGRADHFLVRATAQPSPGISAVDFLEWTVPATVDGGAPMETILSPLAPATHYEVSVTAFDRAGQRSLPAAAAFTTGEGPLARSRLACASNPTTGPVRFVWRLREGAG